MSLLFLVEQGSLWNCQSLVVAPTVNQKQSVRSSETLTIDCATSSPGGWRKLNHRWSTRGVSRGV